MFLKGGSTGYLFGGPSECWPGDLVFTVKERKRLDRGFLLKFEKRMAKFMDFADNKEIQLVQSRRPKVPLNKDRTEDVPGRSVLVVLAKDATAGMLKAAMGLMDKMHYTDFRFVRADDHTSVVPVLYRRFKPLKKMPPGGFRRLYVRLYAKKAVLTGTGCKPVNKKEINPKMQVKFTPAKGKKVPARLAFSFKIADFQANPARAIGEVAALLDKQCGPSAFVNVEPMKGVDGNLVFNALYGLTAYGEKRVEFFPGYFPGLSCGKVDKVCMARIPILFAPGAPPRRAKVVESRPLGFCDKDDIKRVMLKWSGRFRYCYESQLQRSGGKLGGRLQIRFVINQKGRVDSQKVIADTVRNARVKRCVQKIIKGLKFKPPEGGVCVIKWPFVFKRH